jgi:hypothetical protein
VSSRSLGIEEGAVFDLSGDPQPVAWGESELAALETALDGAALLGAELEPRFRVLAVTLEPTEDADPWGPRPDRRVQLLCHPVSTILATLKRTSGDGKTELLTFAEEQLLDVVAAIEEPKVRAPLFGQPAPRPGEWGPRYSLEGRSGAPDGMTRTLRFTASDHALRFALFARFDEVEVRDSQGNPLPMVS